MSAYRCALCEITCDDGVYVRRYASPDNKAVDLCDRDYLVVQRIYMSKREAYPKFECCTHEQHENYCDCCMGQCPDCKE